MRKTLLIFHVLVVGCLPILGQSKEEITEGKFINYIQNHPVEYTTIHLPRQVYFTGDTMQVAGFVTDLFFRPNADISKIVRVTILNQEGQPVQTLNFKNRDGQFSGSWSIPNALKSGTYFLSAHTLYQENFNMELHDLQEVYIQNIWDDKSSYQRSRPDSLLRAYPEGGHLVIGQNQKIIIASPIDENHEGKVINDRGEEVSRFKMQNGLGTVFLTPEKNTSYQIITTEGNRSLSTPIESEKEGAAIKVTKIGSRFFITVLAMKPDKMYLILESKNRFNSLSPVNLNDQNTGTFVIPASSFSGNFHTAALVDEDFNLLAIRAFFTNPEKVKIESEDSVQVLKETELTIQSKSKINALLQITRNDLFNQSEPVAHKMAGHYAEVNTFQKLRLVNADINTDDLLITYSAFLTRKWQKILKEEYDKFQMLNLPELGIDIRGNLTPVPQKKATVNFFQWPTQMAYTVPLESDGSFYLPLYDFSGLQTFTYDLRDSSGALLNADFEFYNSSVQLPNLTYASDSSFNQQITSQLGFKRITAQFISDKVEKPQPIYDQLIYDDLYDMNDYVILSEFPEIVVDILTGVSIKTEKKMKGFRISDQERMMTYPNEPTVIVNNSQLVNSNLLWKIPPLYISEIKVLSKESTLRRYENMGIHSGILGIKLQDDVPPQLMAVERNHNLDVSGFPVTSKSPRDPDIPDFRPTLKNEIYLIEDSLNLGISTSAEEGNYWILCEGIASDGSITIGKKALNIHIKKTP